MGLVQSGDLINSDDQKAPRSDEAPDDTHRSLLEGLAAS
jgi:hypothetical protein